MPPPHSAKCLSCGFAWYSAAMAEGLRALGKCPRCRGELEFAAPAPAPEPGPSEPIAADRRPPHLVLGLPRR